MSKKFIVGNWKSHKTEKEAIEWLKRFKIEESRFTNKEIIVCPPFTLLPILKSYIISHKSSIRLGAQDISPFDKGPYTGEVNGRQIKEFADYVIIGHSERRINFKEDSILVNKKLIQAEDAGLISILCISNINQLPEARTPMIIAYEPLSAIGTGHADSPEDAQQQAKDIKSKLGDVVVLYGGSINPANIKSFTSISTIDGVLVGAESLEASEFLEIILNAQ